MRTRCVQKHRDWEGRDFTPSVGDNLVILGRVERPALFCYASKDEQRALALQSCQREVEAHRARSVHFLALEGSRIEAQEGGI